MVWPYRLNAAAYDPDRSLLAVSTEESDTLGGHTVQPGTYLIYPGTGSTTLAGRYLWPLLYLGWQSASFAGLDPSGQNLGLIHGLALTPEPLPAVGKDPQLSLSTDRRTLLVFGDQGLWAWQDPGDGSLPTAGAQVTASAVSAAAWSPDSRNAVLTEPGGYLLWNRESGQITPLDVPADMHVFEWRISAP